VSRRRRKSSKTSPIRQGTAAQAHSRVAAEILGCIVAALIFAGVLASADGLRNMLSVARQTRSLINTQDDLFRCKPVLGRDFVLVRTLRDRFPRDTCVRIAECPPSRYPQTKILGRRLRFWLALLPDYRIGPSQLVICPHDQVRKHDELLKRGELFSLVRRRADQSNQ